MVPSGETCQDSASCGTKSANWRNGSYTDDSVYYAADETNANKHLTGYQETVTDAATGNVVVRDFKDPVYEGKNMVSYIELIQDGRSAPS